MNPTLLVDIGLELNSFKTFILEPYYTFNNGEKN